MKVSANTTKDAQSIRFVIPNMLTLCGMCLGLTSMQLAFEGEWKSAVAIILMAGVVDFFDGFAARLLKGTSRFGAELDSLSDLICFGVAPAILLYRWTLHETGWVGWGIALLFCCCTASRLARFNTQSDNLPRTSGSSQYFSGVPAPAGAMLVLLPMFVNFQFGSQYSVNPIVSGFIMIVVALLMVHTLPTFSLKTISGEKSHLLTTTGILLGVVPLLFLFPWATLTFGGLLYLLSLPISVKALHG